MGNGDGNQQQKNLTKGGNTSDVESEADGNGNLTPKIRSRADSRSSLASNADDFIMVDLVICLSLSTISDRGPGCTCT